jgi:hypothetical protein
LSWGRYQASIWGIPIEARSCLDLTAVIGVSGLLGREAVMQKVSFRKADVERFNIFYREAADGRATAAVVAWLSERQPYVP